MSAHDDIVAAIAANGGRIELEPQPRTSAEHAAEAESLLARARDLYLDDSDDAGDREDYPTEAEWHQAMQYGQEAHEQNLREATLFAAMAGAHASLSLRLVPAVERALCEGCAAPDAAPVRAADQPPAATTGVDRPAHT